MRYKEENRLRTPRIRPPACDLPRRPPFWLTAFLVLGVWSLRSGETGAAPPEPAPPSDATTAAPITRWLTHAAVPLKSVLPGEKLDDLRPLKQALKGVRIVGLGEATHGTREFFQLKHRLVEFLVREMNFTVFALEASYSACASLDDYVRFGKGSRSELLARLDLWPWDTEEVTALIEWMRAYNRTVAEERRIRFVGIDVDHARRSGEQVRAYLQQVAPEHVALVDPAFRIALAAPGQEIDLLILRRNRGLAPESPEASASRREALQKLARLLTSNREAFIRRSSPEAYERAAFSLRTFEQFVDAFSRPYYDRRAPRESGTAIRDRSMAENARRVLNHSRPGTRMVIWAHNGHITTHETASRVPALGAHLRERYGSAYYALGLLFSEGGFQARFPEEGPQYGAVLPFRVGAAPPGATEWFFTQAGLVQSFVDFRKAEAEGPVAQWLREPHPVYDIGAFYSPDWPIEVWQPRKALRQEYDGVVFIRTTSRARPTPSGRRGPQPESR